MYRSSFLLLYPEALANPGGQTSTLHRERPDIITPVFSSALNHFVPRTLLVNFWQSDEREGIGRQ